MLQLFIMFCAPLFVNKIELQVDQKKKHDDKLFELKTT